MAESINAELGESQVSPQILRATGAWAMPIAQRLFGKGIREDDVNPSGTCSKRLQQHPPATKEALDVTSFIQQQLKRSIDPKDLAAMSAKD